MNTTIKYLCSLSLLLLLGFMTACDKENIDDSMLEEDPLPSVDTLLCDLSYELVLSMGGGALETVTVSNLTGGTIPYSYNWNTGDTSETIVASVVGTYSVTVTDANNCTLANSIEVTLNTDPCDTTFMSLSIIDLDTFPTGTKRLEPTVSDGAAPYTYVWSTGDSTMYTAVTMDGTYSLTVTDANGCTETGSITVTIVDPCDSFVPEIFEVDSTLFVDVMTGTPPFTYMWQDSSTNPTFEANMIPGTYSVIVTDSIGCMKGDSINL